MDGTDSVRGEIYGKNEMFFNESCDFKVFFFSSVVILSYFVVVLIFFFMFVVSKEENMVV